MDSRLLVVGTLPEGDTLLMAVHTLLILVGSHLVADSHLLEPAGSLLEPVGIHPLLVGNQRLVGTLCLVGSQKLVDILGCLVDTLDLVDNLGHLLEDIQAEREAIIKYLL